MTPVALPDTCKIGDTAMCRVQDLPVHWRDKNTMVFLPNDARTILRQMTINNHIMFTCTRAGETTADYNIERLPNGITMVCRKQLNTEGLIEAMQADDKELGTPEGVEDDQEDFLTKLKAMTPNECSTHLW
jgi:hypothetical protein